MAASKFVINYNATTGLIESIVVFPDPHEHDGHLSSVLCGSWQRQVHLSIADHPERNHVALQSVIDAMRGRGEL